MKRLSNRKYRLEPALRVFTIIMFYVLLGLATWAVLAFLYQ